MTKLTTIVFDLDGTLLYTLDDLTNATNYAMKKMNMPERTLEEVRSFVGNGLINLVRRAVPEGTDEETIKATFAALREYYDVHCLDYTVPYDGVIDLAAKLKDEGYKLAIVSNKVDSAVKELSKKFFGDIFEVSIGEKEGVRKKPAPDTVYQALSELGSSVEEAVYIGDSDVDLMTAKNSGLPCISVLWGFRDKDFLISNGATTFANDVAELYKKIKEM